MRGRWRWGKIMFRDWLLYISVIYVVIILIISTNLLPPVEANDRREVLAGILVYLVLMGLAMTGVLIVRLRTTGPLDAWFRAPIRMVERAIEEHLGTYTHCPVGEGENEKIVATVLGNQVTIRFATHRRRTVVWVDPIPEEGREEFMVWLDGFTEALKAVEREAHHHDGVA